MKLLTTIIIAIVATSILDAQHQHNSTCGTSYADQQLIMQRLLENRKNIKQVDINAMQASRAITYLPLSIHNIADLNGNGYIPVEDIYVMLCNLNNNYADQDVQFFIYDTIHYRQDYHIHDNHWSLTSTIKMSGTYKIPNTINMYITTSPNANKATSYYSPSGDFIAMYKPQFYYPGPSITQTHEIGHYLTLPHTFVGWENTDAEGLYGGGNVPTTVNGKPVEYVARTGAGANCSTAADKFCDTPADYYSQTGTFVNGCTNNLTAKDPSGASLDPDENNYMSYYSSTCVNLFSTEQKGAMAADILSRSGAFSSYPNWTGWASQTPNSTVKVSETGLTYTYPINLSTISVPASGSGTTTLDWAPITGATMYIVELYPATSNGVYAGSGPIWKGMVKNADAVNIANTYFTDQFIGYNWTKFAWRVRPLNDYWTCTNYAPYTYFDVSLGTGTIDIEKETSKIMDVQVNPNPVVGNNTTVTIISGEGIEGTVQLYSIHGQLLAAQPNQYLEKGETKIEINLNDINAGTYVVVVQTAKGAVHKKLIIQK
ncbi:MAG: T9SS type A sorting domain-containing protein [Aureispira sp.]|nr:T9SS type A sorting domain-containing protein [Aureispira sp.]